MVWNPKSVYAEDGARVNAKSAAAVDAWRSLLGEVDPERRALWIAEGDFFDLLASSTGSSRTPSRGRRIRPASWRATGGRSATRGTTPARARSGRPWRCPATTTPASPGATDVRGGAPERRVLRRTFQGAIDSRPDWVVITSFNEWLEGTQIEPSQAYGRRYLELTRTLADRFRAQSQDTGAGHRSGCQSHIAIA